jgi:hypothetical protein
LAEERGKVKEKFGLNQRGNKSRMIKKATGEIIRLTRLEPPMGRKIRATRRNAP